MLLGHAFEFIPAQASPIPKFNELRESIRTRLQSLEIVPCGIYTDITSLVQPQEAVRILPKFRDLVGGIKIKGSVLSSSSSLRRVLHHSLDLEKYNAILEFQGVTYANDHRYTKCVQGL